MSTVPAWEQSQDHSRAHYRNRLPKQRANNRLRHFDRQVTDLDGRTVLEVGGGHGIIHAIPDCQGIAIDPLSAEWAGRYRDSAADGILAGIGETLPLTDDSIDTVFTWNVLDHCLAPLAVLEEIRRVLRPDGELLFCVNTYDVSKRLLATVVKRLGKHHPHYFRPDDVRSLLNEAGLVVTWDRVRRSNVDLRSKLWQRDVMTIGSVALRLRHYHAHAHDNEHKDTGDEC